MRNAAEPFIKNIYARKDFRLVTAYEQVDMEATENRLVRFGSEADYESLLALDLFVECVSNTPTEPIVNPSIMPVPIADPVVLPVLPVQPDAQLPAKKSETITEQDDDILCPRCESPMILSVNASDPKNIYDVMYCPGCRYEYEMGTKPADHVPESEEPTPAPKPAKSARTMSRCPRPECGKVKAASAPMCKKCMAEAKDGS